MIHILASPLQLFMSHSPSLAPGSIGYKRMVCNIGDCDWIEPGEISQNISCWNVIED